MLAALVSLALAGALLTLGASSAAAAPAESRVTPRGHGTCAVTAPGSRLQRQGAAWTCLKVAGPDPAPARAAAPADLCADPSGNRVVSTRHAYCTRESVRYALLDDKGQEIGHALVAIVAPADLKAVAGAQWREDISVFVADMTPNIPGVTLALSSTCSGQCIAGAPAWGGAPVVLRANEKKEGTLTYSSTVANGAISFIQPTYQVQGEILGATPIHVSGSWYGPEVRCDAAVGNGPGCIVMGHLANVTLRKSLYGAAAVAYEWAQKNLTANNFGTADKPLLRDANKTNAENRRKQSCTMGPLPFRPDPTVINDSCDEFPFASSTQGGTNGSLCAEIIPRQVNGVWSVKLVRGTLGAPCIRAHVPLNENTGAGGELGRAVVSDRIIDHEWYQVIIVP
ncbi:NucA/NucB deoxyribonuclease domain-containing protein [Actinomadura sp. CNU-125]|uniref:NucA/NucB deoxyribonuclease domain-containing protein n=1 Tax=Actinomadura sp. CNU-125 TaxID=1904961 RepID=UPI0021CCD294|nr:NucA/NucB deoxyribonuclease domain-containing protein [Actinomadura sp. CNU-125]